MMLPTATLRWPPSLLQRQRSLLQRKLPQKRLQLRRAKKLLLRKQHLKRERQKLMGQPQGQAEEQMAKPKSSMLTRMRMKRKKMTLKRKLAKQGKVRPAPKAKEPEIPPVAEMVPTAIWALRDNPRKGSSLAAIKGFMAEEWGINVQTYAPKIKKYILKAVDLENNVGKSEDEQVKHPLQDEWTLWFFKNDR